MWKGLSARKEATVLTGAIVATAVIVVTALAVVAVRPVVVATVVITATVARALPDQNMMHPHSLLATTNNKQ
jgi:hypothetical protein